MMEIIGLISAVIGLVLFFVFRQYKDVYSALKNTIFNISSFSSDLILSRKTYYKYKKSPNEFNDWDIVIEHLEKRYNSNALMLNGKKLPVTIIWENTNQHIDPDKILGQVDISAPPYLANKYHRKYIKEKFEAPPSPIKHESINYRMVNISLNNGLPIINGALGRYYDNILTQYAIEWELNKFISKHKSKDNLISALQSDRALPLRNELEMKVSNPLVDGSSRCASLTISTFLVFRRSNGYYCLLKKRSANVGLSPNMFHVVPAGMFESAHKDFKYEWSVKYNSYRELLEEVYNKEELISSGPANPEYLYEIEPMPTLLDFIKRKKADLSVTGICVDMLNLRTEICTILSVDDEEFVKTKMQLNWEYEDNLHGTFALKINDLGSFIDKNINAGNIVCSGAVSLELGRRWLKNIYNIT